MVSVCLQIKRSGFEPWPGTLCCVLGQETSLSPGLSLSFEEAVACKLSPVAVKYVASGDVSISGLSI